MKITLYSTTTCPYCKMLKDYLTQKGLTYDEKLVDQEDSAKEEMVKESGGFMGVPFTVFEKEEGFKDTVVGFDKGKIDNILEES